MEETASSDVANAERKNPFEVFQLKTPSEMEMDFTTKPPTRKTASKTSPMSASNMKQGLSPKPISLPHHGRATVVALKRPSPSKTYRRDSDCKEQLLAGHRSRNDRATGMRGLSLQRRPEAAADLLDTSLRRLPPRSYKE